MLVTGFFDSRFAIHGVFALSPQSSALSPNKDGPPCGKLELGNITIIKWDHLLSGRFTFSRGGRILFSIPD